MLFSDRALSRRLERAEGYACLKFAEAHGRAFPESHAEWIECAGTYAVFDGVDSPVTQSFGLGLFQDFTPSSLDVIERFFNDRGARALHEVSPFAGVGTLDLLCARNYRPVEVSTVLFRRLEAAIPQRQQNIRVRLAGSDELSLWTEIHARGWAHEHPELLNFLLQVGKISAAREASLCFLAEVDGQPGAAAVLCIHEGVGLLGGCATVPELRRRGLQAALLAERMSYAFHHGCDLAMMVAEPGSNSQRNAERNGFHIAYTRTKWQQPSVD